MSVGRCLLYVRVFLFIPFLRFLFYLFISLSHRDARWHFSKKKKKTYEENGKREKIFILCSQYVVNLVAAAATAAATAIPDEMKRN